MTSCLPPVWQVCRDPPSRYQGHGRDSPGIYIGRSLPNRSIAARHRWTDDRTRLRVAPLRSRTPAIGRAQRNDAGSGSAFPVRSAPNGTRGRTHWGEWERKWERLGRARARARACLRPTARPRVSPLTLASPHTPDAVELCLNWAWVEDEHHGPRGKYLHRAFSLTIERPHGTDDPDTGGEIPRGRYGRCEGTYVVR